MYVTSTALTQVMPDYIFQNKMGLSALDGKVGSNNGFDGIFIKGTTANPQKIFITESKQWSSGVKLAEADPITGLPAQMSDAWIQNVADRLEIAGKIEAANLVRNHTGLIEKVVVTVNLNTKDINLLKLGNF
jgi:hypothetical protein